MDSQPLFGLNETFLTEKIRNVIDVRQCYTPEKTPQALFKKKKKKKYVRQRPFVYLQSIKATRAYLRLCIAATANRVEFKEVQKSVPGCT